MPDVCIVIPSYNGRALLQRYLPPLLAAAPRASLLVVDNGSVDGSREWLQNEYPDVEVLVLPTNRGVAGACNAGIRAAQAANVLLLNNDMLVMAGFLEPLRAGLDAETFAVVPKVLYRGGVQSATTVSWIRGTIVLGWDTCPPEVCREVFFGGECALLDRQKFLDLGGFDELYSPIYFEDVDISYRAWKRGWRILYEPRSVVHHEGSATAKTVYGRRRIEILNLRNRLLFTWKNIRSRRLLLEHLGWLLPHLVGGMARGRGLVEVRAFAGAIARLRSCLASRRRDGQSTDASDESIFLRFQAGGATSTAEVEVA